MNPGPVSPPSCSCLSDQRDGRSRRNIRCVGQPRSGQPHRPHPHPHPASDQQSGFLQRQSGVGTRSQSVPARDPSCSGRLDSQGSAVSSWQRGGHRTRPRRGAGANGRTVVQSYAAERRGGRGAEVKAFPEVRVGVITTIRNHLKGFP